MEDTIAIVGGAIGGLCTAIGLQTKNVPVHIYEAAPAFAEIGAGVSFGPNSVRAMSLISPSIRQAFHHCETNNAYPEHQKHWFAFRRGQDKSSKVGTPILNLHCDVGQTNVHRAKFLDELIKEVPDGMASFGKRLERIEENEDHVVLHFKDGSSVRHAAVICCDGIKSRGRQILLGEGHPATTAVFSGKYAYRGLIPMDDAAHLMGDELARNSQLFMGHGGHILTFPIEKGKLMNVVAFGTADKWDDEQWVKPMRKEDMYADFSDWVEATHSIVSLMQKADVWALFDMPHAPTYTRGRICLLGDAAHASTPHQGAGAGMAIEDALVMSNLLEGLDVKSAGVEDAFKVFDQVRRPRTQKLVDTSREAGLLYDFQQAGIMDDEEKIIERLNERMKWIWDFDLEQHVIDAQQMLKSL